jgi:hypothetical protein
MKLDGTSANEVIRKKESRMEAGGESASLKIAILRALLDAAKKRQNSTC